MCSHSSYLRVSVDLFTIAIKWYKTERSYYGILLYCYAILNKWDKALKDAHVSIQLAPQSAKGYFRRGKALLGLQGYNETSEAFNAVLKLEFNNPDTVKELHNVHIYELKNMGFSHEQAEWVLDQGAVDVRTAVNVPRGPNAGDVDAKENPGNLEGFRPLCWMGNRAPDATEKMLLALFRRLDELVHIIRVLYDRPCAFITYGSTVSPGKAIDAMQDSIL